jgi:outer membrane biosynthesis protein TonB
MSLNDGQLQISAMVGTLVLAAGLLVPTVILTGAAALPDDGPKLAEMEAIEASLAYKKPNAPKQPQKHVKAPEPDAKPDGVSHDADKKPDPDKKPDEPKDKKPDPNADPLAKFKRHNEDDDSQTGKPNEDVGAFDGSEFGFAEETKGDPYFQKLVADLVAGWEYPQILSASGVPVGCLHLSADGKVAETKFKDKSGDSQLDDSVDRALTKLQKARNENPVPVPTHLLKAAITRWVCFKFKLDK